MKHMQTIVKIFLLHLMFYRVANRVIGFFVAPLSKYVVTIDAKPCSKWRFSKYNVIVKSYSTHCEQDM